MDRKSFLKAGHTPTLLAAFLYFDLAFMVWVILGPLGVQIAKDLGLKVSVGIWLQTDPAIDAAETTAGIMAVLRRFMMAPRCISMMRS